MRRQNLLVNCAAAALAMSFGATAWAGQQPDSGQQQQSQQEQGKQQEQQQQGQQSGQNARERGRQTPEGYVLIEENTVYMMANEPQQHFMQAHADLGRKDYRAASEETRLSAAYFDMQAARKGDPQAKDLTQQADQLRNLAKEMRDEQHNEKQQNKPDNQAKDQNEQKEQNERKAGNLSVERVNKEFARASDVLAKHFDALTKHDLQRQNFVAAGYDLSAAANCFKDTIIWSDQKPSKDDLNMIRNAQASAFHLRSNEIYRGEQALKAEQKEWKQEGKQEQASKGENQGQAEQAGAKLPAGVTNSPLTGTTPAEARNDAQHAQELADALGKAIDQFDSQIGGQAHSANASGSNGQHEGNAQSH